MKLLIKSDHFFFAIFHQYKLSCAVVIMWATDQIPKTLFWSLGVFDPNLNGKNSPFRSKSCNSIAVQLAIIF